MRRYSRSCGLVARVSFFCLQRGSGRLIKSNVAPKLCDTWHIFLCFPGADGSKNNCDFAGFDLNGDWIFQSSHAPVKTAIIILLFFPISDLHNESSQAVRKSRKLFRIYFQRTACIICKACCLLRTGFPRSAVPLIDLPVCRASMRCFPAGA